MTHMTHIKSSRMRVATEAAVDTNEIFDSFFASNSRIRVAIKTGDTHKRQ